MGRQHARLESGYGCTIRREAYVIAPVVDPADQIDYPWASLPNGAIINDLGGGIGSVLLELAKEYPHLQLILQDLPKQIEIAQTEFWPKEYPKAIEEGLIHFKTVNFLMESPVAGCDIYYVSGHTKRETNADDCS